MTTFKVFQSPAFSSHLGRSRVAVVHWQQGLRVGVVAERIQVETQVVNRVRVLVVLRRGLPVVYTKASLRKHN